MTKFLKERKDPRPFFLYLAFGNPHDPRVAAKAYFDLYDREKISLPFTAASLKLAKWAPPR